MSERARIRWKPAVWILALGAVVFAAALNVEKVWPSLWPYEQARNMVLISTVLLAIMTLAFWWLLFSRASWAARGVGLGLLILPAVLYRHVGMTGDFVPIFEARFWGRGKVEHVINAVEGVELARPDFPQFLGPERDGKLAGPPLDADWNSHPPKVVWRKSVGPAWSGFAVVGGHAVTQEERDGQEWIVCCKLATGEERWRTPNDAQFSNALAGTGPRATPTIANGRVFTLGSTGVLRCVDLADGRVIWTRDLRQEASVKVPEWGFSSSPLVVEGKVIVSAGGKDGRSLLAFQVADGAPAWHAGDGEINYSSPFLRTLAGRPQVLIFNSAALSAHDPATGALLWEYGWPSNKPNVAQPLVVGPNRVLISSGYAYGSELVEVTAQGERFNVSRVWKTSRFQAKFSNPVEKGGYVYGVSDGDFACLDLRDGSRKWKGAHYGHGQCLMVGELFLQVAEEKGDIVLLRPTPEEPHELARFNVFDAKTWNPIALCGDLLLMRNDREAVCLQLPLKQR